MNNNTTLPSPPDTIILPDNVLADIYNNDNDEFNCNCEKEISTEEYFKHHIYLSTHTFYGSNYKYSTRILQAHGFDIEIDNWDK